MAPFNLNTSNQGRESKYDRHENEDDYEHEQYMSRQGGWLSCAVRKGEGLTWMVACTL